MGRLRRLEAVIAVLALAGTLRAQTSTGRIAGEAVDHSGAPVAGATVTAARIDTGLTRRTQTNERGVFLLSGLRPGRYLVRVSTQESSTKETITLAVNQRFVLNVQLGGQEEVAANDKADLVVRSRDDPWKSSGAEAVDPALVESLPINGRSFQSLTLLESGIVLTPASVEDRGQMSSFGMRPGTDYATVDGVSANFGVAPAFLTAAPLGAENLSAISANGGTNSLVAVDAMREFEVRPGAYEASLGRTPGAQISIVTRSGTNDLHGSVFHYFRNDKLDAAGFFPNRTGVEKPATRLNDFGFVFGGPIQRDRTFFFGAYEAFRVRQPQSVSQLYPTAETRRRAVPSVSSIVNAFPMPNGEEAGNGFAWYRTSYSSPSELDAYSLRLDHAANGSVLLFGRVARSPSVLGQRGPESVFESLANNTTRTRFDVASGAFGAIQTLGPAATHEARVSWSRSKAAVSAQLDTTGGAVPLDMTEFLPAGVSPGDSNLIVSFPVLPAFVVGMIADNRQTQWEFSDNLDLLAGRHEIRIGANLRELTSDYPGPGYRQLLFFQPFDQPLGLASGVAAGAQITETEPVALHQRMVSAFAQDSWRVQAKTTLTLGLRWDYNPAPGGRDGLRIRSLDVSRGVSHPVLRPAGEPMFRAPLDQFAPRIGLAHRLGGGLVLRAAAGFFQDIPRGMASILQQGEPTARTTLRFAQPAPLPPTSRTAEPPAVEAPFGQLYGYAPDYQPVRAFQSSAGLEGSLGGGRRLRVAYIASSGRRLAHRDLHLDTAPVAQSIDLIRSDARSSYHALQWRFVQQWRKNLRLEASHTWSHSIDDSSQTAFPELPGMRTRSSSNFDARHTLAGALTYQLPSARRGWTSLVGGWEIDALWRSQSALPLDVFHKPAGIPFNTRPDLVAGQSPWISDANAPGGRRLNQKAFQPTAAPGVHGSLPRNALRAFSLFQLDVALRRRFRVTEGLNMEIGAEVFNLPNRASFAAPPANLALRPFGESTRNYGRGLGTGGLLGGQNPLHAVGTPRSVQLTLRLRF